MPDYVWPLGNGVAPDEMNTSFGPRVDEDRWDFHDGIDLPAPTPETPVHAMRGGTVHLAGPGGTDGYSSRHVVVRVADPAHDPMYNVYLHLAAIDPAVVAGAAVAQGQVLGLAGADDATYPHLHLEFRKGTPRERGSVHPLRFLPYPDTANFTAPVADRFNRLDAFMAARLRFGAPCKREGDLRRVEVDLRRGSRLLATRVVDFDDKGTVVGGKGDRHLYVDGIGVEGYQKSNMVAHGRADLDYGILVRGLPRRCDNLVARVHDLGGNVAASGTIAVPADHAPFDEFLTFEDGRLPPSGWSALAGGAGTALALDPAAARSGARGLRCADESTTEAGAQRAAIERELPPGRFEWRVQAWLNPAALALAAGQSVYLLHVLGGDGRLAVAARIARDDGGELLPGLVARGRDGRLVSRNARRPVVPGRWRRWRLELLRVGTRETTAILRLDRGGRMVEQARLNWDSSGREPLRLRVGIGRSSRGAAATVLVDEVRLTEAELSP